MANMQGLMLECHLTSNVLHYANTLSMNLARMNQPTCKRQELSAGVVHIRSSRYRQLGLFRTSG